MDRGCESWGAPKVPISVALADLVIRNICGNNCKRRSDLDTPSSYAFFHKDPHNRERLFFIPRELAGDGYTQAQLEEIEQALAYLGFDLSLH